MNLDYPRRPKSQIKGVSDFLRGLLWLFGWLTLGGALLFHGLGGRVADIEPQAVASVAKPDLSPEYRTKSIEDIVAGDIILAANPKTGRIEPKRVLQAFKRITNHLRILQFADSKGRKQEIKTTDEHPFWVIGKKDFVNAGELKVGDKVTGPNGELQTIVSTLYEPHPEGHAVYNFEVEDYHTYYVKSHGTRGPPLLVHNAKSYRPRPGKPRGHRQRRTRKEQLERTFEDFQDDIDDITSHPLFKPDKTEQQFKDALEKMRRAMNEG